MSCILPRTCGDYDYQGESIEDETDPNADNDDDDQGKYAGMSPVCDDEHDYQENQVKMTDIIKLRMKIMTKENFAGCRRLRGDDDYRGGSREDNSDLQSYTS